MTRFVPSARIRSSGFVTVTTIVVGAWASSLALPACSSETSDAGAPASVSEAGASPCGDGFNLDPRGFCAEIVATEDCPAGTRPRIGSPTCEPVGPTACAAGTMSDPSGWGCTDAFVPASACAGATREKLGESSCVPVGDCDAPFPPAGAIVVDDGLSDAQIDASHVRTIGAAISAAKAGATIAVDEGTYAESLTIAKPLTIVGRCAARVSIVSPGGDDPGIAITNGVEATLRGLAIEGQTGGIHVSGGSNAVVEDVVVSGSKNSAVLVDASRATLRRSKFVGTTVDDTGRGGYTIAAGGGSEVEADDVTIDGGTEGIFGASKATKITVRGSVIAHQAPDLATASRSAGIRVVDRAELSLERSVIRDLAGDGAIATESQGLVAVKDSVLRGVRVSGSLARGYGVVAFVGGRITVENTSIADAASVAVLARDEGASVELVSSVVRGPASSAAIPTADLLVVSENSGAGIQVLDGATGRLDGVAVAGVWAFGIYVQNGGSLDMARSLVDGTRPVSATGRRNVSFAIGLVANDADVTVDDLSVTRSVLAGAVAGRSGTIHGKNLFVRDVADGAPLETGAGVSAGEGGRIELAASAIDRTTAVSAYAVGDGSSLRFDASSLHGSRARDGQFGHGLVIGLGATAWTRATAIFDHASIGVLVDEARVQLEDAVVAANAVGIHVQNGAYIVESDSEEELEPNEVRVSAGTRFISNATKVGSGEIPLPADVLDQ